MPIPAHIAQIIADVREAEANLTQARALGNTGDLQGARQLVAVAYARAVPELIAYIEAD